MGKTRPRRGAFEPWLDHAPTIHRQKKPWRRRAPHHAADESADDLAQNFRIETQQQQPWWNRD
jgi:hypothetical protein